mmetsp:Transcript_135872/g.235688  ORF Transcript_135872/g.235688 Transcript_135872/m.235688 type:complete len:90 (-) Transcript_135872:8-277(-)
MRLQPPTPGPTEPTGFNLPWQAETWRWGYTHGHVWCNDHYSPSRGLAAGPVSSSGLEHSRISGVPGIARNAFSEPGSVVQSENHFHSPT